jgi:hypothetical protein
MLMPPLLAGFGLAEGWRPKGKRRRLGFASRRDGGRRWWDGDFLKGDSSQRSAKNKRKGECRYGA